MEQKIIGTIENIGDLIILNKGKVPIDKRVLTISISHADQLVYADLLGHRIEQLDKQNITVGSIVEISYQFKGSTHEDKKFNNIFVEKIKIAKEDEEILQNI